MATASVVKIQHFPRPIGTLKWEHTRATEQNTRCIVFRTPWRSLDEFVCEPVATSPIGAFWTEGSVRVVNPFFVWAADDPVSDDGRAGSVSAEEGQNLLTDAGIVANIHFAIGKPALEKIRLAIFGENDANDNFRS